MRIEELRSYLFGILSSLTQKVNQINANMLLNKIDNYSLDKIPTDTEVEKWITGDAVHRDVYSFRSRMAYSIDAINNLRNIGFFEKFEAKIKSNNEQGILPNIDGIESIKCLNCGTMYGADGSTCEFDIQIEVKYRDIDAYGSL